jgi:peptide-methionine (S)-S-oxide reductase
MKVALPLVVVAALVAGWIWCRQDVAELRASPQTAAAKDKGSIKMEKATFGGGCFWGVEAKFRQLKGVTGTTVGFEGGNLAHPSYHDVCTDRTGHAEVVQVEYDPDRISYEQLLDVFFKSHDPTTRNRQGPDVGTQYRSVIFYHTPQQRQAALAMKEHLIKSRKFHRPIVTEIIPAGTFWRAEDYHQQYLEKRGLSTCHMQ